MSAPSKKKTSRLALWIVGGMVAGSLLGILSVLLDKWITYPYPGLGGVFTSLVLDWVKPWGDIFIRMLKLIAVPLILISLVNAVTSLTDTTKLGRIGGRALLAYVMTTVFAVSLGLVLVNLTKPGNQFSEESKAAFEAQYAQKVQEKSDAAQGVADASPLQFIVDIVPDNIFNALGQNGAMLQVIFFAILFGFALVSIPGNKAEPVIKLFDGLNEAILRMVMIIMKYAAFGVFALLAGLVADFGGGIGELFAVLGYYSLVVIAGLFIMAFIAYPTVLYFGAGITPRHFFKGIGPAQLLAFSTSSSAATLPVTMDCAERNLGVSKEVSSFVLPMGATVNMDGTSLFQAVSAVFIAQAFGMDLSLGAQLGIVLTATLASIGAAAVPGAGTVMLVIVMVQAKIPVEGIALIFAVDRILDMCRTTVNVTGDSMIAALIAKSENQLNPPEEVPA